MKLRVASLLFTNNTKAMNGSPLRAEKTEQEGFTLITDGQLIKMVLPYSFDKIQSFFKLTHKNNRYIVVMLKDDDRLHHWAITSEKK